MLKPFTNSPLTCRRSIDGSVIASALAPYASQPGVPEILSIYSKYATIDGFSAFQASFVNSLMAYGMTYDAEPTATDAPGAVNDKAYQKIKSDVISIITQYIATETNLPKTAKASLVVDLLAVQNVLASPTATASFSTAKVTGASVPKVTGATNGTAGEVVKPASADSAAPGLGAGMKMLAGAATGVVALAWAL